MSSYQEVKEKADALFAQEKFAEASEQYKTAINLTSDKIAKDYCALQIQTCEPSAVPAKKKSVGSRFKFNPGQEIMKMIAKKLLPKIKPQIQKQKPKVLAFMRGEVDFKGQPIEGEHQIRRIVIDYKPSADGNPENDDIVFSVLYAEKSRVQFQMNENKESLAHEHVKHFSEIIDIVLNANLDEMLSEVQKEAKDKKWLD